MFFKKNTIRLWHKRISIVFIIPMVIVSITAIFMIHDKAFSLKNIIIAKTVPKIHDILLLKNSNTIIASKSGLFLIKNNQISLIKELKNKEFRKLNFYNDYIYASGRDGIYKGKTNGKWIHILDKDVESLLINQDILRAIIKGKKILISKDNGLTWKKDDKYNKVLKLLPAQDIHLGKLMNELHTGKIFLGKKYEWLWVDSISVTLLFLSFSGFILWLRTFKSKIK